jgi:histidine ammonia-lyase
MSIPVLHISQEPITLAQVHAFLSAPHQITLDPSALEAVNRCRAYLNQKMTGSDELHYGINTGFGYLQHVRIDKDELESLQKNLLMSHACGLGEEVPADIVRLMLLFKIKSLCQGYSGVQVATVQRLADMINENVLPVVYTQGSLGASGDLAPLSHLCLPLIGMGEVWMNGVKCDAATVWQQKNWQPIALQSKEGLALINGTQFMSAYGVHNLIRAKKLTDWSLLISAMSFDGFDCVPAPFNDHIHQVRPHAGQIAAASRMRSLLAGSAITAQPKSQVQDPYSFRCIPQVMGASMDAIEYIESVFMREVNAVTDNPNIFPDADLIVSGGNFHGQPLAINLDYLCIALSEMASIAERRTYQLISGQRQLPAFLVKNPGLHSGFMIPQYTAAGIVSENKQLSTPASVDTIPSSNNQEDHVSMGANAATKCKRIVDNLERVLAIELLTAAQALDFRRPLRSSEVIEATHAAFRRVVSFNDADRILHTDMLNAIEFIRTNEA